jgi:hypothetical protein
MGMTWVLKPLLFYPPIAKEICIAVAEKICRTCAPAWETILATQLR